MINSLESRIARLFRQKGYYTIVSSGSRGAADVVAIKHNEILFIQCKLNCGLSEAERQRLVHAAFQVGAKAIIAISRKRHICMKEI